MTYKPLRFQGQVWVTHEHVVLPSDAGNVQSPQEELDDGTQPTFLLISMYGHRYICYCLDRYNVSPLGNSICKLLIEGRMRRKERRRKREEATMHTHYENAFKVLRNIKCEVAFTFNAQLRCNSALFGKGNIYSCLQLVLQAIMTWSAFPACLFPSHALSRFGSVNSPEQRLPQQNLLA